MISEPRKQIINPLAIGILGGLLWLLLTYVLGGGIIDLFGASVFAIVITIVNLFVSWRCVTR
ncbi:MAG: hypothetical protein D5R99_03785 [Methanocalculus sp. MSAO_Arc1]|uniref:hypothetical protein n=1 Tax=Methanocalculus TaxID=71151 RepID=UPI000FF86DB0|nr:MULTISPECIES: hypothetical protein [unclassified Methanocalculus]MCP1662455.1 hypothetical protein [Methanocalculus sp. AMF5]RQD80881.1 MAG: hypothetical protein D5R99_03785 [Methanocalculus sp. MSAO_Arc1]